jgi:hypothetical protein
MMTGTLDWNSQISLENIENKKSFFLLFTPMFGGTLQVGKISLFFGCFAICNGTLGRRQMFLISRRCIDKENDKKVNELFDENTMFKMCVGFRGSFIASRHL